MKKRLICLLTAVIFLLSSAIPGFASEAEVIAENVSVMTENMRIMNSLDIAAFTDEAASEKITRGEFAGMAGRILGYIPGVSDSSSSLMTSLDYMKVLSNINIIKGYSDGEFRENNYIKYDEALVIAVTGLGYGPNAIAKGGYPYGYRIVASEKKLLKNIELKEGYITNAEAADLCLNMLKAEYLRFDGVEGGEVKYVPSSGSCLMEDIFGVTFKRGVLDGVDLTRLAGDNDIAPGYISVDGTLIKAESKELYKLIGYSVEVYFEEVDGILKLLYIEKSEKNKEYVIDISDVTGIDSVSVSYEKKDGYKNKYTTEKYRYIMVNGVSTGKKLDLALLKGREGILKLLDNDGDGAAEVIFVESCVDYVVAAKDESKSRIYDKMKQGRYIDLDTETNDPYVEIFSSDGKELSFGSISAGNTVSIYESSDDAAQKYIRAEVSSVTVSGTVEAFDPDEGIISVAGEEYRITEKCLEETGKNINPGDAVEMNINCAGAVAYFENLSASSGFGYLVNASAKTNGPDASILFKIYHKVADKYEFGVYEAAKYYEIDEVRYQNGITADVKNSLTSLNNSSKIFYGAGIDSSVVAQFISFETDENGLIKRIDTAATGADGTAAVPEETSQNNSLFVTKTNSPYYERSLDSEDAFLDILGNVQGMVKSCPMYHFPYPNDGTDAYLDESKYFVDTINEALESVGMADGLTFVVRKKDSFLVDAVAVKFQDGAAAKIKTHERFAAVNKVSRVIDDGVVIYQAEVFSQGRVEYIKAKTDYTFDGFTSESDPTLKKTMNLGELKHGDLIRYKNDSSGYVGDIEFYYRPVTDSVNTGYVSFKPTGGQGLLFLHAYVMKKDADGYWLAGGRTLEEALSVPRNEWRTVPVYNGQSPMLYDFNGGTESRISTISINSYSAYEDVGEECTEMFVHFYGAWPFGVYAIKR